MLRRFNSLIKGPKGAPNLFSDDELSELHVSLQPALSVDSSLFTSSQHHHVNPLQQQLARAREESLTRARSTRHSSKLALQQAEQGQLLEDHHHHQVQQQQANGFVMGRVPEERSWKEGYEHGASLDLSTSPTSKPLAPGPAAQSTHTVETHAGNVVNVAPSQFIFAAPAEEALRTQAVHRTSSGAPFAPASRTASQDLHTVLEIPDAQAGSVVDLEFVRKSAVTSFGPGRTISSWSSDSAAEHCRVCQQRKEEPLIELGCLCRGELSKSHKSCIEMWFKNKGTNKCEVCQHVASNIPAPDTTPAPHFWVWRLAGAQGAAQGAAQGMGADPAATGRVGTVISSPIRHRPVLLMLIRNHPLIPIMWLGLIAFMTYLFVGAVKTANIGYAAIPIGFLFGVLVVLGLGTAVRLVLEYVQERNVRRNIRLMEMLDQPPANENANAEAGSASTQNQGPSAV